MFERSYMIDFGNIRRLTPGLLLETSQKKQCIRGLNIGDIHWDEKLLMNVNVKYCVNNEQI